MQVTDDLVNRFLTWPVPASVYPDGEPGKPGRTGTNLLTHSEARAMLEHVLEPLPEQSITITRRELELALCHWEEEARQGKTRTRDETAALPIHQVAVEGAALLWCALHEVQQRWPADLNFLPLNGADARALPQHVETPSPSLDGNVQAGDARSL